MNNSESIREFFRRMADGAMVQQSHFQMLHNSSNLRPRSSQSDNFESVAFFASQHDFGVGLPPMAHS